MGAREPVEAADHQRRELGAAQVAEARRARAEDRRRRVRDRVLVQRVEEDVLREVALGERAQGARLQQRQAPGLAQVPAPRLHQGGRERVRAPSRAAPRARRGCACRRAASARRRPGHPQQRVEPRLVVGEPMLHHPRLVRQPVRWRAGRRVGVQRRRLGLGLGARRRRPSANTTSVSGAQRMAGAPRDPTPAAGRPASSRPRTASPAASGCTSPRPGGRAGTAGRRAGARGPRRSSPSGAKCFKAWRPSGTTIRGCDQRDLALEERHPVRDLGRLRVTVGSAGAP